ncbi:hypothetical protein QF015_000581 [Paenarthrobacter sp. TE4293]
MFCSAAPAFRALHGTSLAGGVNHNMGRTNPSVLPLPQAPRRTALPEWGSVVGVVGLRRRRIRGVNNVNTLSLGLGRTSVGLSRIAYVFWSSQCSQGLECSSSPTSGTAYPLVRGGFCFNVCTFHGQVPLTLAAECAWRRRSPVWLWGSGFKVVAGEPSAGSVLGVMRSSLGTSGGSWLSYTSSWVGGLSATRLRDTASSSLCFRTLLASRCRAGRCIVTLKRVWTLSTLKSPLLRLITAIPCASFGLHLLIPCKWRERHDADPDALRVLRHSGVRVQWQRSADCFQFGLRPVIEVYAPSSGTRGRRR